MIPRAMAEFDKGGAVQTTAGLVWLPATRPAAYVRGMGDRSRRATCRPQRAPVSPARQVNSARIGWSSRPVCGSKARGAIGRPRPVVASGPTQRIDYFRRSGLVPGPHALPGFTT
jgi:hypothetical protein